MTDKQYNRLVKEMSPKSPLLRDGLLAFLVGGCICLFGQFLINRFSALGLERKDASNCTSVLLVAISAFVTGLSLFDNLAKHAGAGTLIPITGFANAVAAPAVEFKTEGYILGIGAKMFTIAGPVIVYGLAASAVYGFLYWLASGI